MARQHCEHVNVDSSHLPHKKCTNAPIKVSNAVKPLLVFSPPNIMGVHFASEACVTITHIHFIMLICLVLFEQRFCKSLLCSMFNEQTCTRFTRLFVRLSSSSSPCPEYLIKPYNAIFFKCPGSEDIKTDIHNCQIHKYTNTHIQIHKYSL